MKLNMIPTIKLSLLCATLAGAFRAFSPSVHALTIGDPHELGFVNFGIPSGDSDRLTYVNHLVGMALGTSDKADGQTLHNELTRHLAKKLISDVAVPLGRPRCLYTLDTPA